MWCVPCGPWLFSISVSDLCRPFVHLLPIELVLGFMPTGTIYFSILKKKFCILVILYQTDVGVLQQKWLQFWVCSSYRIPVICSLNGCFYSGSVVPLKIKFPIHRRNKYGLVIRTRCCFFHYCHIRTSYEVLTISITFALLPVTWKNIFKSRIVF